MKTKGSGSIGAYTDPNGEAAHVAIGAGVGAVVGFTAYMITSDDKSIAGALKATAIGIGVGATAAALGPAAGLAVAEAGGGAGAVFSAEIAAVGGAAVTGYVVDAATDDKKEITTAGAADAMVGAAVGNMGKGAPIQGGIADELVEQTNTATATNYSKEANPSDRSGNKISFSLWQFFE